MPMVQAAVASFVGEHKIAKNVNADEAGVLGKTVLVRMICQRD